MPGANAEDEEKARTGTVSHTREVHPMHTFYRPVEVNAKLYPKWNATRYVCPEARHAICWEALSRRFFVGFVPPWIRTWSLREL